MAERIATGGPIEALEAKTVRGALLLTDIAGFSACVDEVSTARPSGLEEFARDFNNYFTDLVGVVYGHGGDVVAIAGDAFFSYWPAGADDGLVEATLHAAEAGLELQRVLGDPERPAQHRFQTRAGLSAGELDVALVGGIGSRWEVMPVGRPIDEVARAERLAAPGTVALAESAWQLVASRCEGRPNGNGLVTLDGVVRPAGPTRATPAVAVSPQQIEPFVPLPVRQRRVAGTKWMQESRRVTVVMASLGTEAGGAAALEMKHLGVRAFQQAVARFEGAAKLLVDNKGVTLCGVFGLPPHAHLDDAGRAVAAAVRIRRELDDVGLVSSVGVATGRGFCGVFGDPLRREYTLHGGVVNLAAALMQSSSGDILCADETVRAAGDRLAFEALEPISVKGSPAPVAVHRPSRARQVRSADRPAMVGREPERAMLEKRIDGLAGYGSGGSVLVVGEAGIGKSRLVAEAIEMADARSLRVLMAAADPVESATSYYAWRSVFADVLELTPATLADPHALEIRCDPELRRLRPLLSSIVPVGIPDNAVTAAMDGNVRAENTKLLLASILRHATAEAPALVVVEDAHWLDSNSWALLLDVVGTVPNALFLVAARPTENPPKEYVRLRDSEAADVAVLHPLNRVEIGTLVGRQLGVAVLPAELTDFVEERVAGHPMFCEQLVQTMREDGQVRIHGAAVVLGDLASLTVPVTIEGAVTSRIDRITAGQRMCLKVAAVIGGAFEARTVEHALHGDSEYGGDVEADLEALAELELTARERAGAYRFGHEITRRVTYGLLVGDQRRRLHRAVAEWHELAYTKDELAPHYALLAHHWARADDPGKAVTYLESAGRQALRGGAFREALRFLTEAIEVEGAEPDPTRDALCIKGIGTAHYFLGDFASSRACLAEAVARLERPFPSSRLGVARGLAGAAAVQVAHLVRPSRFWRRREADAALIAEALGCQLAIGQIGYLSGEPLPVLLYGTLAGLNLGEEAGRSPELARILIHAATASSVIRLERLADRYAARAIAMVYEGAPREAGAYVWNVWAVIGAHRGHWDRAEDANAIALERLGEVGDFNLEAEVRQTQAAIYIFSGKFGTAETAWSRHRELAERKGNPQNLCWSLLDEAQTWVARDEIDDAERALAAALAVETDEHDGSSTIEKHYTTAIVRSAQGRHREAVAAADAVMAIIAAEMPSAFHYVEFCAEAVRVYFAALEQRALDRSAMLSRARRGCRLVRRTSWSFGSVRSRRWLLEGKVDWEEGRQEAAQRAWRRAEAAALSVGAQYDLARARFEIARHGGAGVQRRAYLEDAAATLERLGALQMLRQVREAQEERS